MSSKQHTLSLVVQAIDKVTAPMRQMGAAIGRASKATGLDKLAGASWEVTKGLGKAGKEALKFGTWMVSGIGAATGAMFALVKGSAGLADQLAKTADRLGIGIESLQRLRYAADLSGVSTQTFDMALQRFTRRAAEAADGTGVAKDAFKGLGIQLKDAEGNLRPTEDLMADVADKMAMIEDPAKRVRLAFTLFDSEGVKMVNMLKNGGKAIRDAGTEADRLGLITEEQARAAEEFNDNLARLMTVVKHFSMLLANELMPHFGEFIVYLREVAIAARPQIIAGFKTVFSSLTNIVRMAKIAWYSLSRNMEDWLQVLMLSAPILVPLISSLWEMISAFGMTESAVSLLATALGVKFIASIAGLFVPLAKLALSLVMVTVKMTMLAASGVKALISGLVAILPTLGGVIAATWAWTAALLANPLMWIVAGILAAVGAIAGAAYLVYKNWDDIISALTDRWEAFSQWLSDSVQALIDMMPDWIKDKIGLNVSSAGHQQPVLGPAVPSALGNQQNQINGGLRVTFDNLPQGAKVRDIKSDTPGFDIDVDAGYAMAGP